MDEQKEAERTIELMNKLWKEYKVRKSQALMKRFCQYQQWLSNRDIAYHQNKYTGNWELINDAQ